MALQALDRDLWVLDHPLRVAGLALGTRTTIVRLSDGALILLSPGPLTDEDAGAITALGPVRALVAPNLMHHLYLAAAHARFPAARLYAPAGLTHKQPALRFDGSPEQLSASDSLVAVAVGGMPKLDEHAFVHRPSRTLILVDLAFNLRPPTPWLTRTFMRFNGGFDRFGPTRICRSLVADRAAVRASIDRLLLHDFERVIVAHGQVLAAGGRAAVAEGFAWLSS